MPNFALLESIDRGAGTSDDGTTAVLHLTLGKFAERSGFTAHRPIARFQDRLLPRATRALHGGLVCMARSGCRPRHRAHRGRP